MYLSLDLGTSALKLLLVDMDQRVVAELSVDLSVQRPQAGHSEQDPQAWLAACEQGMQQLRAQCPHELAAVRAIGLAGQMHGATVIDKSDKVLAPCILWNDTRAHQQAAELDAQPEFRAISGNIVFPGFTAPKLLWLKDNQPEIFAQVDCVLLPKDYLRLWLSGERISEMSDAAGTSWLDCAQRCWSEPLLRLSSMRSEQMPALVEGSAPGGQLRPQLAQRWGMRPGVLIAGGAGDNAAAAVGMGVINPGDGFISLGSSGVLFAACSGYQPKAASAVHSFCHALPERWHHMGVTLAATDALNWAARLLGASPEQLIKLLPDTLPQAGKLCFLPYLGGERTPHNDARIRAALIGLDHDSDNKQIVQAVLEGVSFAFADNLQALRAAGSGLNRLVAVGGGSRARIWVQMLATVLDLPIDLPKSGAHGAALGAARLAMLADQPSAASSLCSAPDIAETIEPVAARQAEYWQLWQRYQQAYQLLREH